MCVITFDDKNHNLYSGNWLYQTWESWGLSRSARRLRTFKTWYKNYHGHVINSKSRTSAADTKLLVTLRPRNRVIWWRSDFSCDHGFAMKATRTTFRLKPTLTATLKQEHARIRQRRRRLFQNEQRHEIRGRFEGRRTTDARNVDNRESRDVYGTGTALPPANLR